MNEIRDIHNPFKAWLDQRGIPFHRNRPDKKTTAIKGDPDFLLTWCNYCVYIECKVPGGKLSKDQEKRIAYLRKAGNKVVIAYSLQDCIEGAQGIFCHGEHKNAVAGPPEPSECPLDNEPAAELIAAATNLSGNIGSIGRVNSRNEESSAAYSDAARPAQNLWIANICTGAYVFSGDPSPGGLAKKIRAASPQDLRDLPRK